VSVLLLILLALLVLACTRGRPPAPTSASGVPGTAPVAGGPTQPGAPASPDHVPGRPAAVPSDACSRLLTALTDLAAAEAAAVSPRATDADRARVDAARQHAHEILPPDLGAAADAWIDETRAEIDGAGAPRLPALGSRPVDGAGTAGSRPAPTAPTPSSPRSSLVDRLRDHVDATCEDGGTGPDTIPEMAGTGTGIRLERPA
jgi:hypothetical protein